MARRRSGSSRAQRHAAQQLCNHPRNRWVRLASLVDKGIIRRPNYVHEQNLTHAQREDISAVLQDWLRHLDELECGAGPRV